MTLRPTARVTARLAGTLGAILVVSTAPAMTSALATPADTPAPTTQSVTKKLDALGRLTEQLAEKFNKARVDVRTATTAAHRAEKQAVVVGAKYRDAQSAFARQAQADYQASSLGSAGALLESRSGGDYLTKLSTLDLISTQQANVLERLKSAKRDAADSRDAAAEAVQRAKAARSAVGERRTAVADRTKKLKDLLATLTAREQAQYAARNDTSPATAAATVKDVKTRTVHAGNAAAQRAVDFALAQLGKPYAFGASGPGSYDCSGLTAAAWQAGGVSLPHVAADQYNYGTHVSADELQPGDLVFFYSPIGHVSIYIGNGQLVSAPQTGENVKIVPLSHTMPDFVGATRLA